MRRSITVRLLMFLGLVCIPACLFSFAQEEPARVQRRVIRRVDPMYPQVVHTMHLKGRVVLEVTVEPSGDVKSVKALGGSPILVQSATFAVEKWKWERSGTATKELLQLSFGSP